MIDALKILGIGAVMCVKDSGAGAVVCVNLFGNAKYNKAGIFHATPGIVHAIAGIFHSTSPAGPGIFHPLIHAAFHAQSHGKGGISQQ